MEGKYKKVILFFLLFFICIGTFFILTRETKSQKSSSCNAKIALKGNRIIFLKVGEEYQEPGYQVIGNCGSKNTNKVQVENHVINTEPGTYEILYTLSTKDNHQIQEKRYVTVKVNHNISYQDSYDRIDNQIKGWGIPNKKDGNRPVEAGSFREELTKYNTYFIGKDEKILYLTFDEGSNDTYMKEIVEVLNDHDVKATFFFCKNYILDNSELMKTLVESGHSVGNHTANHVQMPLYATRGGFQKYLGELMEVEDVFQKVTGKPMDPIYREPKGEYSFRSLQILKDLGYKTYFWSIAYVDFAGTLTKEQALQEMTSRVHNGAVYLLHPKNKGNYEALGDFIDLMQKKGYRFDLVKNIT